MHRRAVVIWLAVAATAWGCGVVVSIEGGPADADADADAGADANADADADADANADADADADAGRFACAPLPSRTFDAAATCEEAAAASCATDATIATGKPCVAPIRSCRCSPGSTSTDVVLEGTDCTCVR